MDDCILDILGALEDLLCDEDDDGAGNQWNSCERKEGTGLRDGMAFNARCLPPSAIVTQLLAPPCSAPTFPCHDIDAFVFFVFYALCPPPAAV